jgi:hypothetical protein
MRGYERTCRLIVVSDIEDSTLAKLPTIDAMLLGVEHRSGFLMARAT